MKRKMLNVTQCRDVPDIIVRRYHVPVNGQTLDEKLIHTIPPPFVQNDFHNTTTKICFFDVIIPHRKTLEKRLCARNDN